MQVLSLLIVLAAAVVTVFAPMEVAVELAAVVLGCLLLQVLQAGRTGRPTPPEDEDDRSPAA